MHAGFISCLTSFVSPRRTYTSFIQEGEGASVLNTQGCQNFFSFYVRGGGILQEKNMSEGNILASEADDLSAGARFIRVGVHRTKTFSSRIL